MHRIASVVIGFVIGTCLQPIPAATAETLAAIDQEIQSNQAIKTDREGLDAFNIYEGVTIDRMERKVRLLAQSDIHPRFYQTGDGVRDYTNLYSFTSRPGVTDTKLDVVRTDAPLRLYRRGDSGYKEASGYLGSWWSDRYRGLPSSRDELAILAAWGSDLQRIYVIDMPAGQTLIGGTAAPMERNGEYRPGGGSQYYYRGAPADWLVYALFAPDYLKSYAGAVTSAQKLGRGIATDLGDHLDQTRQAAANGKTSDHGSAVDQEDVVWLRGFGGDLDLNEDDGNAIDAQTMGMSIGWQRMFGGTTASDRSRSYLGLLLSQGIHDQQYQASGVENSTRATMGGLYGLYLHDRLGPQSWFGSCSLLYGGLDLDNSVPGELGHGLDQEYDGNLAVLTVANGMTFRRENGWSLTPQLQLSYARMDQDDFSDGLGARVRLHQGDSWVGRLGLEVGKTLAPTSWWPTHCWTKFSYVLDLSDANEVWVADDLARSALDQENYLLTVGVAVQLNQDWSLRGQVETVFGDEQGVQGSLALHYAW